VAVFCHGKGNPDTDGCCWVNGAICPLRLKVVNGRVYEGPNLVDRGTITQFANSIITGKANRDRVVALLTGPVIACKAATEVIAGNGNLLTNRAGFETAWNTHTRYVAEVRPHWAKVEEDLSLPAGSYQCSTWKGTAGTECCFAEPEVTNLTKRADLSTVAVTVRQAGGLL
jgi:hypothetical protein